MELEEERLFRSPVSRLLFDFANDLAYTHRRNVGLDRNNNYELRKDVFHSLARPSTQTPCDFGSRVYRLPFIILFL